MFYDENEKSHPRDKRDGNRLPKRSGGFWKPGRGMPKSRRLSAEELQITLLLLLDGNSAHGYELIGALEESSGGFYSPSPGVIYPALAALTEREHTNVQAEGRRKQYSITAKGREFLETNRKSAEATLESLKDIGERMDRVRAAFDGSEAPDKEAEERYRAYRALNSALRTKRGCTDEEAKRIAAILHRAAEDILKPNG